MRRHSGPDNSGQHYPETSAADPEKYNDACQDNSYLSHACARRSVVMCHEENTCLPGLSGIGLKIANSHDPAITLASIVFSLPDNGH